jgi:cell division protein FtsW (lipid II flippase)
MKLHRRPLHISLIQRPTSLFKEVLRVFSPPYLILFIPFVYLLHTALSQLTFPLLVLRGLSMCWFSAFNTRCSFFFFSCSVISSGRVAAPRQDRRYTVPPCCFSSPLRTRQPFASAATSLCERNGFISCAFLFFFFLCVCVCAARPARKARTEVCGHRRLLSPLPTLLVSLLSIGCVWVSFPD